MLISSCVDQEGERGDRALGGHPVDQAAEYRAVRGADAEAGGGGVGESYGLVLQFLGGGEQHSGPGEHQLAEPGGTRPVAVTFEQGASEHPLDTLELGGQGRLCQPEQGRGLADTSRVRDRADDPEVS
jgi:hypothetical protein